MRVLPAWLLLVSASVLAQSLINDTGATHCSSGSVQLACDEASTGDGADYPRQDGRFGRDALAAAGQLAKLGAGAAGFDFTPLDALGHAIPLRGNPPAPAVEPACVRDNLTGLVWEVKTVAKRDLTYSFVEAQAYAQQMSLAGLCGMAGGWRLPKLRELFSIVHYGVPAPKVDVRFFPHTVAAAYVSSDGSAGAPTVYWGLDFQSGSSGSFGNAQRVRLVRGN